MNAPLDELYLRWLYRQAGLSTKTKNPSKTFWSLLKQLYEKEFVWIVPNDDNRIEDGRDLRYEFIANNEIDVDDEWLSLGCSMLEMMIALSRRLAFEASGKAQDWFWVLLENLEVDTYTDSRYNELDLSGIVDWKLNDVIWRTYSWDGSGGLFPLNHATEDQRDVEIWYQLCAYVNELAN